MPSAEPSAVLDDLLRAALASGDDEPLRAALVAGSGLPGARMNLRLVAAPHEIAAGTAVLRRILPQFS